LYKVNLLLLPVYSLFTYNQGAYRLHRKKFFLLQTYLYTRWW